MDGLNETCIRCGGALDESQIKSSDVLLPMCISCFQKENKVKKAKQDEEESNKPSKITDKIYLGDEFDSKNKKILKELGITHILVSGCYLFQYHPGEFKYKTITIDDTPWENIKKYFKECVEFIDKAEKVFVHCAAGVSRSPSMVIAYLMKIDKMTFDQAFDFVKSKRKIISPNPGFIKQLKEFYAEECS